MGEPLLLRRADRDLLKRCRDALAASLEDTAESIANPDRRLVLEELVADLSEELGAKVVELPNAEQAKPRTIKLMDGREMLVR